MKKIVAITGSRADYGILKPIFIKINESPTLKLQIVATNAHLSEKYGKTIKNIEADGLKVQYQVDNISDISCPNSMAKSSGQATILLADIFLESKPDIVLLLGDRYETHAAASAALLMNIPIAHIHGGEISEGSIDEQLRHSITKMSHIHFCSTEIYRERIIQMGENPKNVYSVGAPGIDDIFENILNPEQLSALLDWDFVNEFVVFLYHPETLINSNLERDLIKIEKSLLDSGLRIFFIESNADFRGTIISDWINKFCSKDKIKYKVAKNLDRNVYLSLLSRAKMLIGNSSSGIIEAASYRLPVVNIGVRQTGREKNPNVIDCKIQNLDKAIKAASSKSFKNSLKNLRNIYGNGNAAQKIVEILEKNTPGLIKQFCDLECNKSNNKINDQSYC